MTDVYSADTDDLDAFVEHSSGNVAAFGATADGLEAGRGRLALLPLPSFVQSSTLDRYRDLVGFMAGTAGSQPRCPMRSNSTARRPHPGCTRPMRHGSGRSWPPATGSASTIWNGA